ncbi:hypothetical protein HB777_26890 [Mesorhizobium loti]|nr:hypothetical protein HB777_26890 [Mesorhizobium loti]
MIRIGFVAALLLTGTVAAAAALPPYWQRQAEIRAIADSADLAGKLESRPIDAIEHMGTDRYRVGAGGCTLDVLIVDDTSAEPMPGPRKFKLQIGKLVCK